MNDKRKYLLWPSDLSLPYAFEGFGQKLPEAGISHKKNSGLFSVTIDNTRELDADDWDNFLNVLKRFPHPINIQAIMHVRRGDDEDLKIEIRYNDSRIEAAIESRDIAVLELLHRYFQECFHASNPNPERSTSLSNRKLKKSIFLAHRFDENGQATANAVRTFLERIGFAVAEGTGYQARAIPAKVAELIERQDILLAVFTRGDMTWVSSEAAFASGKHKYVVCLAEEDIQVRKGILGEDYEHLTFPCGFVEKAFSDLLYALPK